MLALRYEDGSEQVLVLTDLLTGRSYGIDEADLTEPVREWIRRTTADRRSAVDRRAVPRDTPDRRVRTGS